MSKPNQEQLDVGSAALIVVERSERELDAKLLMANKLTARGFNVTIGTREKLLDSLRFSKLIKKRFLWIDKSCPAYMSSTHLFLKKKGAYLVILEEEAWSPFTMDDLIERRFSPEGVKYIDEIWGSTKNQYTAMRGSNRFNDKNIHFTSHPRIDVLKAHRTNKNVDKDHTVITFMSTYGLLNPNIDVISILERECGGKPASIDYAGYVQQLRDNFILFCHVLKGMRSREGMRFVFRAHPAEVKLYSEEFISEISKHFEISANDYIHDLTQSDYLVHTGSTVALDSLKLIHLMM